MKRKPNSEPVTWETVCELARSLPGAEEGASYGTPAFRVGRKLFVRFHQSGESIVVNIQLDEREALMRLDPQCFYITDHYLRYPYMLVRLSAIKRQDLSKIIEESWRRVAPRKLLADLTKTDL